MAGTLLNDEGKAGFILLQALGNEQNGLLAAQKILQCFPGPFPWISIMENLGTKVPTLDGSGEMILKPKLVLLPLQTQRNILRFLNYMFYQLPASAIHLLADTISVEDHFLDAWLLYLRQQFLTRCGIQTTLQRSQVAENLHILCKQLNQTSHEHPKLDWYKNRFASMQNKNNNIDTEMETIIEDIEECRANNSIEELSANCQSQSSSHKANIEDAAAMEEIPVLPLSIEAHIPKLKQFLFLNMEFESLDHEFLTEMDMICELCNPIQLQTLFSSAGISLISMKCLLQLCIHLDSISPDLSYAHAKSLAGSLFLDRVLSLTSTAPRTLTEALSVFCNKYAHPACSTLIGPLLVQAETGSVYADFLSRMVSECLQPEQLQVCLSPILDSPCTEVAISVLHLLINKKDKFCQSEFVPLLNYLCHAAENFSKSVAFSKLLQVFMTSKANLIQLSHLGQLTCVVNCNQTFMKKSLQNALRNITKDLQ